jgi:hypothetical protein
MGNLFTEYYRHVRGFSSRILWDLNIEAIRSRRYFNSIRGSCNGRKAIIICNGPSLNSVDLDSLKEIYCFGLNKIYLKFKDTKFRPDSIVCANLDVAEQSKDYYRNLDINSFFLIHSAYSILGRNNNFYYCYASYSDLFSKNCSYSINVGGTVTYFALQIAYHMGFTKVALIGCDHYFSGYKGNSTERKLFEGDDLNHFDPNYFKGQIWGLPNIPLSEYSYSVAKEIYEMDNRKIYNCTDGGFLEVFERVTLKEFLEMN